MRVLDSKGYRHRTLKWQLKFSQVGHIVKKVNDVTYVVYVPGWRDEKVLHVNKLRKIESVQFKGPTTGSASIGGGRQEQRQDHTPVPAPRKAVPRSLVEVTRGERSEISSMLDRPTDETATLLISQDVPAPVPRPRRTTQGKPPKRYLS